jgi:Zn-dependent peptidase ImmA (M78 family)
MVSGRAIQIELAPSVLRWARERSRLEPEELARRIPVKVERVEEWERTGRISLAQIDKLANKTHTPEGFLFLSSPPDDRLEIPDLRTVGDQGVQPSPDLLDTVHAMQRRQAWMRDDLIEQGVEPLTFVGSVASDESSQAVAGSMREVIGLGAGWANEAATWVDALRLLQLSIDDAGILTVSNGVVGNNTHRPLDPDEFRGFSIVDEYAPLIFVNAADYKSAQMFTLAHELAHVWLDASGVSNPDLRDLDADRPAIERRCNVIAAEFLIPAGELRDAWASLAARVDPYQEIARRFKTSRIVAARRLLDSELISRTEFFAFWDDYQDDERRTATTGSDGGHFWNTQGVRLGRRFSAAVVHAVQEGRLLYQEAYSLTGLRGPTFDTLVQRVSENP